MSMCNRIVFCVLIVVLAVAVVPWWGGPHGLPCQFGPEYAISYAAAGANTVLPDAGFPGFPPHCMNAQPWQPGIV